MPGITDRSTNPHHQRRVRKRSLVTPGRMQALTLAVAAAMALPPNPTPSDGDHMDDDRSELVPETVLEAFGFVGANSKMFERGVINRHWLVARGDESIVIRRYHPSRTAAAIGWEQRLVQQAASRSWPVAAASPAADGSILFAHEGRFWAAAPFLPGESRSPGSETPAQYHIIGRLLGRLHRDLAGFASEGQRPDFGKLWELDAWVAPAGFGSFNQILRDFETEYPDLAQLVRRQRYRSLRELSRLKYPDLPELPIHGDFQRWNLLWQDGQLTGLLDFDQARLDAFVADIAPLLMPHMPLELPFARALLEGYQSVRPLSDTEWDLLPALVRASLLWWVAYVLADWRRTKVEPGAIFRTMTVRFPAFDAREAEFRSLRGRARV
ncbi:MAG: phosphotransferase enzyme family protein [Dehalococcoidia bacterium]